MFKLKIYREFIDGRDINFLGDVYSLATPTVGMQMIIDIPDTIQQSIKFKEVIFLDYNRSCQTQTVLISF